MGTTNLRLAPIDCGDYIDTPILQVQTDDVTGAVVYQTDAAGQVLLDGNGAPLPVILGAWDEVEWKPGSTGANQIELAQALVDLRPVVQALTTDPVVGPLARFVLALDRTVRADYTGTD